MQSCKFLGRQQPIVQYAPSALHIYQLIEINFSDKTSQMQRWSAPLKFGTRTSTFKNSYVNN